MKRLSLSTIRFYQVAVSPYLPSSCRYEPTCSRYAYEAIERFGVVRGIMMAARRVLRCSPLHEGGYDPVPEKADVSRETR